MTTRRGTGRAGARTKRGTTSAPLKNYLSESSLSNIFETIRRTLAEGGARRVAFEQRGHVFIALEEN